MRFTVRVRGEWLAVPGRATDSVFALGFEALKRYVKNKPDHGGLAALTEVRFTVRRCQGLGLLDHDDLVEDVLQDNDFVELALEGDSMSEDFLPSQPERLQPWNITYKEPEEFLSLDGNSLSTRELLLLGKGLYKIKLTEEAQVRIRKSRELLETIIQENKVVYGITTGFGKFARTVIPSNKLKELQENLIRSHAAGVGKPLLPERTRMLLALRINVLAKGYSGISPDSISRMISAFNSEALPQATCGHHKLQRHRLQRLNIHCHICQCDSRQCQNPQCQNIQCHNLQRCSLQCCGLQCHNRQYHSFQCQNLQCLNLQGHHLQSQPPV